MRRCLVWLCVLASLSTFAAPGQAQVRLVPRSNLYDMLAVMAASGPAIVYDSEQCANVGTLSCRFGWAHEYGHIVLGHVTVRSDIPEWIKERDADCFAARYATPAEVAAGIRYFDTKGRRGAGSDHGSGFERARRIADMFHYGVCHW